MSGSFAWVCICILDGGHFSFPDADADPGTTGLALRTQPQSCPTANLQLRGLYISVFTILNVVLNVANFVGLAQYQTSTAMQCRKN